jgi:hypothetical protein
MSFTLATLKSTVQDYLQVSETTFNNNLDTFIKESESRIFKSVQLPEQRKNVQGTLSASNRFLATPDDFFAPFSLAVIDSSKYYYLNFKHPSFIKEYSPTTTTTGRPKYYSLFDNTAFELSPDVIATFETRFKEGLERMRNLSSGRETRDEFRYDMLRTGIS